MESLPLKILELINQVAAEVGIPEAMRKNCSTVTRLQLGAAVDDYDIPEESIAYYREITRRNLEVSKQKYVAN